MTDFISKTLQLTCHYGVIQLPKPQIAEYIIYCLQHG